MNRLRRARRRFAAFLAAAGALSMRATIAFGSGGSGGHVAGHHEVDWMQLAGQITTFVIFLGLVFFMLRKSLPAFFNNRHETIKKAVEEAQLAKAAAEAKAREYQQKMADLESEMRKLTVSFEQNAETERKRLLAEAEATAKRISADAEAMIQSELEKAQATLRNDAAALAVTLAGEILQRELKADDHKRLVGDFMKTLSAGSSSKKAA